MPSDWTRTKALLAAAAALPPKKRADYIRSKCADEIGLRNRVLTLLRLADTISTHDLFGPARPPVAHYDVGMRIGAFLLVEEIGLGGAGKVFLARQETDLYSRNVALKIIGMPTDQASAVLHEPALQSSLEHPNIARLYESGLTEAGDLFIAMEFIRGIPIDEYSDRVGSLTDTLDAFILVCRAVAFAHKRGVVHGDLKPGNILVSTDGSPHLLDFGVASTGAEQRKNAGFTPRYASPERIKSGNSTVLSDVFALGTILREIVDPYLADYSGSNLTIPVAKDVRTAARQACAPSPESRYQSVEKFCEDLERCRVGRPLIQEATMAVLLSRLALRHHKWLKASRWIAATFVVLTVWFRVADPFHYYANRQSRIQAQQFAANLASSFRASNADDSTARMADVLDQARVQIDSLFANSPVERVQLLIALGEGYLNLGLYEPAHTVLTDASLLSASLSDGDLLTPSIQALLATAEVQLGRHPEAGRRASEFATVNAIRRQKDPALVTLALVGAEVALLTGTSEHAMNELTVLRLEVERQWGPESFEVALVDVVRSRVVAVTGENEAALKLLAPLVEQHGGQLLRSSVGRLGYETLASLHLRAGDPERARSLLTQVSESVLHAFGPNHRELAIYYRDLARCDIQQGRDEAALVWLQRANNVGAKLRPSVKLTIAMELSRTLIRLGHLSNAEQLLQDVMTRIDEYGNERFARAQTLRDIGILRLEQNRIEEAIVALEASEAELAKELPVHNRIRAMTRIALSRAYVAADQQREAQRLLRETCMPATLEAEAALKLYGLADKTLQEECSLAYATTDTSLPLTANPNVSGERNFSGRG